jgi:hypothetical protein
VLTHIYGEEDWTAITHRLHRNHESGFGNVDLALESAA